MFGGSFFAKKRSYAGLSIFQGGLRYVQLYGEVGNFKVSCFEEVELSAGAVRNGNIASFRDLETGMHTLKERIGGSALRNVVLGIPPRDAFIRVIDMPRMDIKDAREALRWDFEKHVPFPFQEATFDIVEIDYPNFTDSDQMKVMIAASRKKLIKGLLSVAEQCDIDVKAVEPDNLALFRTASGPISSADNGFLTIWIGRQCVQLVVGYRDNGIIYRNIQKGLDSGIDFVRESVVREIRSTLSFVGTQIRELEMLELRLAGEVDSTEKMRSVLEETFSLPIFLVDPVEAWGIDSGGKCLSGWEAPVGLAVRDAL